VDKQRIVIGRSLEEAELFDQKPWWLNEEHLWELLLCRGGTIFDMVHVLFTDTQSVAVDAYHWYPRSLLKTLLLVSAILLFAAQKMLF